LQDTLETRIAVKPANAGALPRAARIAALCGALLFPGGGGAEAQGQSKAADAPLAKEKAASISGNPAATDYATGTGWLGRALGLPDEWGLTLGGLWLADTNLVAAGGDRPGGGGSSGRRDSRVSNGTVPMPMVGIGDVRVVVDQRRVAVRVAVWLADQAVVLVLVMLVVSMGMAMIQGFVGVLVFVPLHQVQPNT